MKKILLSAGLFLFMVTLQSQGQTVNPNIINDSPDSRYIIGSDSTVTDTVTGLMWQQCSQGLTGSSCAVGSASTYTWQQALELNGSSFAGHSDWRLPNIEELRSLVAYNSDTPAINPVAFPNTVSFIYWSSSPYAASSSYAWVVYFNDGSVSYLLRNSSLWVRLVRGGK